MTAAEAFAALGLTADASPVEVLAAYRRLSKRAHPDGGGTAEDFAKVKAAYGFAWARAVSEPCPECGALGVVAPYTTGWSSLRVTCPLCGGTGLRHN